MTDIVTHTYLKQIRMRFVSGQGILELMKLKEKQQMGNGDCLPLYQRTFVGRLCLSFREKTVFLSLGHSCKEIRNAGSHLKDGEYWIALKKNGNLSKVYCDMTTDGGKEWMFKKS